MAIFALISFLQPHLPQPLSAQLKYHQQRRRIVITLDVINVSRYSIAKILSLASKETAAIFSGLAVRSLPLDMQQTARRKLKQLDAARMIDELRIPPGNRLKTLKDDRKGQWSIRINDQWRICFNWEDGNVENVEIVDYH
jgi:proteic killer suppression protein